jgi:DHA2 family multidrug resistance protein-like MFS transporter
MDTRTRATRREWLGLAVLALPTLLLSLDIGVLYLALPNLATDLGASGTQQLWILDIYSFLLAGFLVTMGTLGDRIGRRRVLLIGAAGFGVASVLCAYSTTPEMLIVARALLGVAGATLMPSSMALIRNMFGDPKQMGTALGIWFGCFMGGMALGPVVGGALLEQFWWGSAFLIGVPFMVVLLAFGPILLPEFRDADAGRLDLVSVLLSLAAILPVIYGLKAVARTGVDGGSVLTIGIGLAFGVAFGVRQRRLDDPMLDLRLFGDRTVCASLAIGMLGGVVMAGISLMGTLYLQVASGLSPLRAGLWMIPVNLGLILGATTGPAIARRVRASTMAGVGTAISGIGAFMLVAVPATDGKAVLVAGLVVASFGVSLPMAALMTLILGAIPAERAGSVSSLQETGGEFGVAVGVAVMGSLATFVYRDQLGDTMPAGVPAGAADAAREGLTGAVTTAPTLPGQVGADLLGAAREAVTARLNVVGGVGGAILIALAVVAAVVLRRADEPEKSSAPDVDSSRSHPTSV